MKVSIITVCYNSAATVADAMQSVFDQVLPDGVGLEYIVVDGGSTDGTVDIIKSFNTQPSTLKCSDRRARESRALRFNTQPPTFSFRWISEKDNGLYDAMNKGMKMATGEIIGICNSDDMLASRDVVARVARAASDGTDVLGGCVRFVPQATRYADLAATPSTRYVNPRMWRPWMLSWGWTPPHPGLYIRKSAYEKFGYYRSDCEISADDEIVMRLVRRGGASYRHLPLCTVAMRLGGKSTQRKNLLLQNRELVAFNRDNGYRCWLPMMLPKLGIKALEIIVPKVYHIFGGKM